ncbi:hypothetical protein [Pontibacter liquoris]|uniref:hypothetical protein n=1 Tax=Pontibacter liquoris TaxID=2905677 RepID=UPI001FA70B8E|nr:hypothetical protein [Pontibacter liquoris]
MKLIILLFAMLFGFSASVKKSADDMKAISARIELNHYQNYPNMLPEVQVVAYRK